MEGTEENNSMDEMNREAGETVTAEKKRRGRPKKAETAELISAESTLEKEVKKSSKAAETKKSTVKKTTAKSKDGSEED